MWALGALFLLSGFAGLTYQVLWQRELGLLFGNTTEATATTLAVFFLGLALGGWALGRRCVTWRSPLRGFGILELLVATSALLVLAILPLYRWLYGPLYDAVGGSRPLLLTAKFALSALLLLPAAVCMGGTLPVLQQHVVRGGRAFETSAAALYTVNTLGATLGAFSAGFLLPRFLGYQVAYLVAVGASLVVGLGALVIAHRASASAAPAAPPRPAPAPGRGHVLRLAFVSGFVALALEVLWTRMFAQALQNSGYTFAAVLVVFLLALALGAGLAWILMHQRHREAGVLRVLLLLSALAVAITPRLFQLWVPEPGAMGRGLPWWPYVGQVFLLLAGVMLVPTVLLGTVFPYLMRVESRLEPRRPRGGPVRPSDDSWP